MPLHEYMEGEERRCDMKFYINRKEDEVELLTPLVMNPLSWIVKQRCCHKELR